MMLVRLETVAPDLVSAMSHLEARVLDAIALDVCKLAMAETGLDAEILVEAVDALSRRDKTSVNRDDVKALVDRLDEEAWTVQDAVDDGSAFEDNYSVAFALARAASTVWSALDTDSLIAALESTYEAQAATGAIGEIRQVVAKSMSRFDK
jgi:hypothetical protein